MRIWAWAGIVYFAAVFAIGFLLGTVRFTSIIPRVGEMAAVAIELPFMLTASWLVCRKVLARYPVPASQRLAMGAVAFTILMLAELALAVTLAGQTPAAHFATYAKPHALAGLAGQIVFALIPALQRKMNKAA